MHFVPAGGLENQDCFESPCTEAGPFSSLLKDKGQDRQEWSQGPAELCLGQYKPRRHTSQSTPPLEGSASSWEGSVSTFFQEWVGFGTCIILSAPLDHELRQALCYPLPHDPLF